MSVPPDSMATTRDRKAHLYPGMPGDEPCLTAGNIKLTANMLIPASRATHLIHFTLAWLLTVRDFDCSRGKALRTPDFGAENIEVGDARFHYFGHQLSSIIPCRAREQPNVVNSEFIAHTAGRL